MGKLDELRRLAGGNADESMGAGRAAVVHGAPGPGPRPVAARLQGITRSQNVAEIPVERIGPDPDQPREDFDEEALLRLAESLKARGQLQPIRVRWDEGRGLYIIVCGERRWRAARMAGLDTMAGVIVEGPMNAAELLTVQLVENALREDLRPLEQAKAFRALMQQRDWSARQLARELAIPHPNVVRALALLELPPSVQDSVEQGALPPATAYEVSKLPTAEAQAEVAGLVVAEGLSRGASGGRRSAPIAAGREGQGAGQGAEGHNPDRPHFGRVQGHCGVPPRHRAGDRRGGPPRAGGPMGGRGGPRKRCGMRRGGVWASRETPTGGNLAWATPA